MARILGKRLPGEPQPRMRKQVGQATGRLKGITTLIKRDEAKGITDDNLPHRVGVKASLTTAFAGANNDLTFTAESPGGNDIRVAFVVAAAIVPLSIAVAGKDITINVGTSAASTPNSTAKQVRDMVNGSPEASALVRAALATGNDGTGVVAALALTFLAGGVAGPEFDFAGPGTPAASGARIVKEPEFPPDQGGGYATRVGKASPGPLQSR